jgi:outer membrane protein assembly factor BamA
MKRHRLRNVWEQDFSLRLLLSISIAFVPFAVPACEGQETRTEEIEQQREKKTAQAKYDEPGKVEKSLLYLQQDRILDRLNAGYRGWNLRLGGLVQGSGFALGPEFRLRNDFQGRNNFRVGAQLSTKLYQKYYARWTLPKVARDHIALDFNAIHRNYSQIDYFGPGPRSQKSSRTDYRLEDTAIDAALGVKPVKQLQLGGSVGYLWTNVGPGTSDQFPSTDQVFPPSVTPGIDLQTNFLRYGPFAQVDYLDNPDAPAGGGLYTFQYTWYRDQDLNLNSLQRIDAEIQQYFGFFNKTRVLALRAKTSLVSADRGNTVPFYMQSIVGGSEDLRGFLPFRFYDNNSFVLNAEYRWHVVSLMDMALFADGGKVFPRRGQLNFSNLEGDGGIGFRFNLKGRPFLRIDIAGSHEGFQFWFKFNDIFVRQPVGTASAQPIR